MFVSSKILNTTLAWVLMLGAFSNAWAEEPAATPYRPTVSNPAALSAPGYFELELGALSAKGGEARIR